MSLFNTIAHPGNVGTRSLPGRGMAAIALALVVGLATGAIVNDLTAERPEVATRALSTGMAHDEFLRLNTTDVEFPAITRAKSNVVGSDAVDPFLYWNTSAFDGLALAESINSRGVDEGFLEWNISSLEYQAPSYIDQPNGPR